MKPTFFLSILALAVSGCGHAPVQLTEAGSHVQVSEAPPPAHCKLDREARMAIKKSKPRDTQDEDRQLKNGASIGGYQYFQKLRVQEVGNRTYVVVNAYRCP